MPVMLSPADHETWLRGTFEEAIALATPFPADEMIVVNREHTKDDLTLVA